ncbi:conserved exported hypothetical protein [uncultured Sporomusa sp.]|uniref:Uncharacterized protein n=1 Tax=uncultured Sporomusa sp. TaxID=307249 RepID=A0A212LVT7_9FIRM|nr:hypothetical protein [uncultured Sporomusa sp.]SCM81567.1 conserved exported hypothetical protein [uncultured Sporomusa sp.]
MRILLKAISLGLLILLLNLPLTQRHSDATAAPPVSGVVLMSPLVELSGHVMLINCYAPSNSCYAVVELRAPSGKAIVVRTSEPRLQSLLETALATGKLISFVGQNILSPSPPRGGNWNMEVYSIDEITLYNKTL